MDINNTANLADRDLQFTFSYILDAQHWTVISPFQFHYVINACFRRGGYEPVR